MRARRSIWILLCLLFLAGAWLLWHHPSASKRITVKPTVVTTRAASTAPGILAKSGISTNAAKTAAISANTNKFAFRLSNTSKSLGQLTRDERAILLENAFIDTRNPLNFSIPPNLKSKGDPGAYIVQAHGPIDNAFRALLAANGAAIVSYIPNDAYLVRLSADGANSLASAGFATIPYEPYYKVQSSLLAFDENSLPQGTLLNLGLFGDDVPATVQQIENLGGQIFAEDTSPFGKIVRVIPPKDWTALANLPGVQIVEPYHKRVAANDLARVTLGISTNTTATASYMNLTGSNVVVEVNDSGIDATHPDLVNRVFGDPNYASLTDTNGHGTHVAGIIAGSGAESSTINQPPYLPQGSVTNAYFGGKAPNATLFSVGFLGAGGEVNNVPDSHLQEAAALTNALISNNSWGSEGDATYNLEAASFDAATRDALPTVTGSQPVLFVFAAGNNGGGQNDGTGGEADTISAPGTAKNVVTVGALEQLRNITNYVTALDGSSNQVWQPMTDTSFQVADYSSRGNVGIGIEGVGGRFKPDVVAPGTFVVSTRSQQWDTNAYYNPTNYSFQAYTEQIVNSGSANYYSIDLSTIPNAVGVTIQVVPNLFTVGDLNLPIYISQTPDPLNNYPDPNNNSGAGAYFVQANLFTIPPDPGGNGVAYLAAATASGGFNYAVGNNGADPVDYDLYVTLTTTNDNGNYDQVLQGLNDALGATPHYYRYESGTSMATPAISGVLALMQDFFTNQWQTLPSPALLKAMLINGARTTGFYDLGIQNSINFEGWGLANLPDSLPFGITTNLNTPCSSFIQDQNPTNALATGDSRTFNVTLNTPQAQAQPLRVTLVWTDPPGNPAAAIKLVNNLTLVVTNLDNPSIVYYGNDISSGNFNNPETTNSQPALDVINNVQNVYLPAGVGTNFSVTVFGTRVNVNAVTAQTNDAAGNFAPNIVQDYALVISSGNGATSNSGAITVTTVPPAFASNPTGDQQITYVANGGGELLNQYVGANSPLPGTNTLSFTNAAVFTNFPLLNFGTNWQVTMGQTNQWHFYVVTNPPAGASVTNSDVTNAAFITYAPPTLSIPREGVFANSQDNATRAEADIDLYVSTNAALTNLDPAVIYDAITNGTVSLGRGGTEFVALTNSAPGDVYYVGVKSEDQMASEYSFFSVFSATPFDTQSNGVQTINGVNVPLMVPGGNPAVPGFTNVVALSTFPIELRRAIASVAFNAQNLGDLVGSLSHSQNNGLGSGNVILNNHASPNSPGFASFIYDDSGANDIVGSQPSDSPGSLNSYFRQEGIGPWILHEADNVEGFTNIIQNFSMTLQPHQAGNGLTFTVTINGGAWYYDYVDVPAGATNLTITVTNLTGTAVPPVELFLKQGALPTTNDFDEMTNIDTPVPPPPTQTGSISIVPPVTPGTYYFGVYNPGGTPQTVSITVTYALGSVPAQIDFTANGSTPILDDAVSTATISVPVNKIISSVEVGIAVEHPRISDLVFHLTAPDGTRVLLMENRGGGSTNGAGELSPTTNTVWQNGFEDIVGTPLFYTGDYFSDGWHVDAGNIESREKGDSFNSQPYEGNYFIDLNGNAPDAAGEISTNIPTTPGQSYVLNFAYARNPDSVAAGIVPSANVLINGALLTSVTADYTSANNWSNLDWQLVSVPFTAATSSTLLTFQSTTPPTSSSGVLLDAVSIATMETNYSYLVFTEDTNKTTTPIKFAVPPFVSTNGDLFYLPEQSLDAPDGENAQGNWTLEIQDDRAGAGLTNTLASWQLRFNFTTAVGTITNNTPITNSIPPNSIDYYLVHVPTNADLATNFLFTTSGPLNFWFNQTTLPSGTGAPGDSLLFATSTNNFTVLSTTSTPTNIVPGGTYYLAVQNTNAFAVTNYSVQVTFDLLPTSPITNWPVSGITFTNIGGTNGILLTWYAPSNYQFQVQWTTSLSPAPISWTTIPGLLLSPVALTPTNGIFQFFDDGSLTGGFGPIKFYRLIAYPPGVAVPPSFVVNGIEVLPAGGFQIQWTGSTNYNYEVLWTTNLALPTASWQVLTNLNSPPLTLSVSNSVFTLDTGTLTTGAASAFFQVIELP
ncbi:MAG TPA: S8 family serine peptidase [Verrucomicrobiae bacterium]|nr:S8 family serine peptidase [Verrucomicrobiae bacterium]